MTTTLPGAPAPTSSPPPEPRVPPEPGIRPSGYRIASRATGLPRAALDFQARMIGPGCRQADPARADWLTTTNPAHRDGDAVTTLAWRGDDVVGIQAGIPGELRVGSERRRFLWAIDLLVDPEHRGRGVALDLVREQHRAAPVQLAFGVAEGGLATLARAGSVRVATAAAYLCPCDTRVLTAKAPNRAASTLARALGAPAIAGFRALARRAARGIHLRPIDAFGAGVDSIWAEVGPEYHAIVARDSRWARWRFEECPQRDEYERYEVVRRGRVVGYAVLRETRWQGLPALEIVDYLVGRRNVRGVFARIAVLARDRGKAAVVCITLNWSARNRLRAAGYVNRKRMADPFLSVMVNVHDGDPLAEILAEPGALFLTCADCDLDE